MPSSSNRKQWLTSLALTLATATTNTSAFSTIPSRYNNNGIPTATAALKPKSPQSTHTLYLSDASDNFPSDSSSDPIVDVQSSPYEPTESENLVASILSSIPEDDSSSSSARGPAINISSETRSDINEALLRLESLNPTDDRPTDSPLMNGVWSLRYAGGYDEDWALPSPTRQLALFLYSGGYSPGLFALRLAGSLPKGLVETGDLEISISREQPRIEAKIDVTLFGGASNSVLVKARLDSTSDVRLTETYESATVLDQSIDLPQALQYSRDLYVTYLDEEILVVRDGSGVPEILVRKQ